MSLTGNLSAENILIGSLGNLQLTEEALQEVIDYITAQIKMIEAAQEKSCQDIPLTDDMLKDGCYNQGQSKFNATTVFNLKTYEKEVKEGERYYMSNHVNGDICLYMLFDKDNKKVSWFPTEPVGNLFVETSAVVEIPKGVTKLAFSFSKDYPYTIKKLPILDMGKVEEIAEEIAEQKVEEIAGEVVEDIAKEVANSTINEQKSSVNVYKNKNNLINYLNEVLFVGDSFTVGAYNNGTTPTPVTSKNYPYFFSRIANITPTIKAVGGYTPINWYTKFADSVNYADFDTAIVWLGTNGGLTDTVADGASAETNTGYYCRIIEKMIAENPDIVIFLGNVFVTSGALSPTKIALTNNVIEQIAEKYSSNVVGVVDNNDGTLYKCENDEMYHVPNGDIHFGVVGNLHLAEHWIEGICNLIADNEKVYEKI